ncbi:hypothetical protein BBK82_45165 [Lentzea guizhouensis]|uniref:Uncharacterized protein n=1 Tax=Lentzea guizhouensis TaxID=1586287 RepID=A0A1B2HWH8_9PSEU|nr:hypothetical protein [Lentzea guizhouensis]ANZ42063.1 hypothetical protein BBK82_45165 [Lentzea guizhouensis]
MPDSDQRHLIGVDTPRRSLGEIAQQHPWWTAASEHLDGYRKLRSAVLAVVHRLAGRWEDDRISQPWHDPAFAERFTTRVRWVTERLLTPANLRLSEVETALLVVFPYLHQAFWAQQAATALRGTDPATAAFTPEGDLRDFSAFVAEHGTLHRRGTRAFAAGEPAAHSIAWWLFHQWLVRRPESYRTEDLAALLPAQLPEPLRSVLDPERLLELMRVVQIDPAFLRRADRGTTLRSVAHIASSSEFEEDLREQLLGYLLVFAYRTAIDPMVLPRDIFIHLGIDDGVVPREVLASISRASWRGTRTRALTAVCTHPATALALREQAGSVDALLIEIGLAAEESDSLRSALEGMPVHATAGGVAMAAGGEPGHAPVALGHRFRLADDRIQDLLMGEQLYGTPELAVRELYQNALDACRYRRARTAYLRKTGADLPHWEGEIDFRQHVVDGRPVLDCTDNGIGMGDRELVDVFARAGIKFTDLPEYVEEKALWTTEGIESFPNSKFGVGVLSYFMLADEITVTTCRLDRAGRPGRLLEAHIAGPEALFRVRDLGPGTQAGTVTRLHLRSPEPTRPLRCTELLRRVLWVSEFRVTSQDRSGEQIWLPDQLSTMAPIGTDDALEQGARRKANLVLPTPNGRVWWCDTTGAVLADGIWAGTTTFGAVVNLSGHDAPRLTVDRRKIIDLDRPLVQRLLMDAIPTLLQASPSPLSHGWLANILDDDDADDNNNARLADEICERAIEARYRPWRIGGIEMPIEVVGCFSEDAAMLAGSGQNFPTWSARTRRWRLAAWLRANAGPGDATDDVVPARPSDKLLINELRDEAPHLGEVLAAAFRMERTPAEVVARAAELDYPVGELGVLPAEARKTDRHLLDTSMQPDGRYLRAEEDVPHDHVITAAAETGLSPQAVTTRLHELGYRVPTADRLPTEVHPSDDILVNPLFWGDPISLGEPVPVPSVMVAAARTGKTPAEVARRLRELGYEPPGPDELPPHTDGRDQVVFVGRRWPNGEFVEDPVPLLHIVLSAIESGQSPAQVAARLAAAGFEVPPTSDLPVLTESDVSLTRVHDPTTLFKSVHHDEVTDLGHVLAVAFKSGRPPRLVARRLAELGYTPPAAAAVPASVRADDLVLACTTIGADHEYERKAKYRPWLPTGQRISFQRVLIAAAKTGRTPGDVAGRLGELGFEVPQANWAESEVTPHDLVLLSHALNGKPPWLDADDPALVRTDLTVPVGHVLAAAAELGKPPQDVAERLRRLGLRTEQAELPAKVGPLDARLLVRQPAAWSRKDGRDHEFQRVGTSTPADVQHLLFAAGTTGLPPAEVAMRLVGLGVPVVAGDRLPSSVDEIDLRLLRHRWDAEPYQAFDTSFPRAQVLPAAYHTRLTPGEVINRLERLGFTLDT